MKIFYVFLLTILFSILLNRAYTQQLKLTRVIKNIAQPSQYTGIAQDKQGFIWTIGMPGGGVWAALYRYDGNGVKVYKADPHDANTIQNSLATCIYIDNTNIIWIGHFGGGLDRFDPLTGAVRHIRHVAKDQASLSSDTVYAVLEDRTGRLWVGTAGGLNSMDMQSGKFTRYLYQANNQKSISSNSVSCLYEDHNGDLWIGFGSSNFTAATVNPAGGGLNLFHENTGTFTHYSHDPGDTSTLSNNQVACIYEDRSGTLWIGTQENGLQTLDRKTGKFTHYRNDPAHPEKLGSFPVGKEHNKEHVNFICQDIKNGLWVGLSNDGLYRYDPVTKKTIHFGSLFLDKKNIGKDTAGGVSQYVFSRSLSSYDGLFWTTAFPPAAIFNASFTNMSIPFVPLKANGNAFYQEAGGKVLWVGTNKGLIRKDLVNKTEEIWSKDNPNNSGWAHDTIGNMTRDKNGIFWIATLGGGICRFNPVANKAVYYMHDKNNPASISSNLARNLRIDHNNNIWIGTWGAGLDMLNTKTQKFVHYVNTKDTTSLSSNVPDYIYEDKNYNIWVGGFGGLDRLNKDGKTFHRYLAKNATLTMYTDHTGRTWAGGYQGLSFYDNPNDRFLPFIDPATEDQLGGITNILEDNEDNLWLRTTQNIVKINKSRNKTTVYAEPWGVNINNLWICRSLNGEDGELFFGTLGGYYDFFPDKVSVVLPPRIAITEFQLNNQDKQEKKNPLINYDTKQIELPHDLNGFSFDFVALHYDNPGEERYQVKLENYDHAWRDLGTEHRMPFFDVPPGKYVLRIKAFNVDGAWAEKDLTIVIDPPWWKTWWAYTLFGLAIISSIWGLIEYRGRKLISENKILEQKVNQRTLELQQSLQELKATQTQLIQSEKMASLGELTAGIAHEIQNPLNFVNNFSEVNKELIEELEQEIDKGDLNEIKAIALDIKENEIKINHHGKRADFIVKGMLQHSRTSTGERQPTNINVLADEFFKLSYHGLRAKDKSFNAEMTAHFDNSLPPVNVVQQEIGRVMLNLFNNAFYAVNQKRKTADADYKPEVTVTTFAENGQIIIKVKDNGIGIPDSIKDKIMQPFFTTKPTGEGTGLGLSLTYDMVVKGHGGSIHVNSVEGEGTTFTIKLPGENK